MGVSAKPCVQRSAKAMRCAAGFLIVAGLARVIAEDVPHHVTQRGNARGFILDCDADRMAYLNLLRQNIELHGVGLIGYCLMSNHVHLVVTPHNADGLGLALRHTHGRYAFIGTRFISRASMPARVVITPAHWIGCICGKGCAIRS